MDENVFINYGVYQTRGRFFFHDATVDVGIYPYRVPERVGPFATPEEAVKEARRRGGGDKE